MNESLSDIVFVVDGQRVPALRDVLKIKSKGFEEMFKNSDQSVKEWSLEDTDLEAFKAMVRFLYTEELILNDEKDCKLIGELMRIAVKYRIYRLVEVINEGFQKVLSLKNFEQYCKTAFDLKLKEMIPMFQISYDIIIYIFGTKV